MELSPEIFSLMIGANSNQLMKTLLITGINGFLGSHLAKYLTPYYNIIGLEHSGKNLSRLIGCDYKIFSVERGIPDSLFTEQHIDAVIHTATFYGRNNESPKAIANANLFIPFELLDRAIQNNCSLFINADTVLDRYTNYYSLTKHQFHDWLYMRKNEIHVTNIQMEHIFGPGAQSNNFIISMAEKLLQNEPSIDLTLGEQQRNFVYISDVVQAYKFILEHEFNRKNAYANYQLASNELITIHELMNMLKKISGGTTKLCFGALPYRENELMLSHSDNSSLSALGWKPQVLLHEGLSRTIEYLRDMHTKL
jgi:CDP-paratose synthetase